VRFVLIPLAAAVVAGLLFHETLTATGKFTALVENGATCTG